MKSQNMERPVDRNYELYKNAVQHLPNGRILYVAIPLMLFGLLCFIWALPFPYLAFLGRYNGYLNWASFFIAGLIYYHLRLSPIVSYIILFMFFAFSYGVIQLEQWQKRGGPQLWLLGLVVFLAATAAQWILFRQQRTGNKFKLIIMSPTWLAISLLKVIKLKY